MLPDKARAPPRFQSAGNSGNYLRQSGTAVERRQYLARVRVFADDVKVARGVARGPESAGAMRIAFDSRPASKTNGVGSYTRCLLAALRETVGESIEIVETHRPYGGRGRRVELFHTPWMEGAVLRSPCPMVVTLHDLDVLTRRSERLRRGGMHTRLRHLALQRATRVIVHSEALADDVLSKLGLERERVVAIPPAADDGIATWSWQDVARATREVYERALAEPARPFISRPRAASRRLGSS
jgi:glycosyl transferase family 4